MKNTSWFSLLLVTAFLSCAAHADKLKSAVIGEVEYEGRNILTVAVEMFGEYGGEYKCQVDFLQADEIFIHKAGTPIKPGFFGGTTIDAKYGFGLSNLYQDGYSDLLKEYKTLESKRKESDAKSMERDKWRSELKVSRPSALEKELGNILQLLKDKVKKSDCKD